MFTARSSASRKTRFSSSHIRHARAGGLAIWCSTSLTRLRSARARWRSATAALISASTSIPAKITSSPRANGSFSSPAAPWLVEEKLPRPLVNATLSYLQTDYAVAARLETLLARTFDTCIVLADESSGERDPDARTIVTILLLQDNRSEERRVGKECR